MIKKEDIVGVNVVNVMKAMWTSVKTDWNVLFVFRKAVFLCVCGGPIFTIAKSLIVAVTYWHKNSICAKLLKVR